MKKKYLILFIFLLSGCSIIPKAPPRPSSEVTTPSPSTISYIGWQEYTNVEYNYRIKYPHDWHFYKINLDPPPPMAILLGSVPEDQTNKPHVSFQITINKDMERDLSNHEEIISLVNDGYFKKDVVIASTPAVFLAGTGQNTGIATAYVKHNDYIYRLSWNGTHPDVLSQSKEIFMKILGSFAFTDKITL